MQTRKTVIIAAPWKTNYLKHTPSQRRPVVTYGASSPLDTMIRKGAFLQLVYFQLTVASH